jgi:hypothetical protein
VALLGALSAGQTSLRCGWLEGLGLDWARLGQDLEAVASARRLSEELDVENRLAGAVREDDLLAVVLGTLRSAFTSAAREKKLLAQARQQAEADRRPERLDPLRKRLADLEAKIVHGNGNLRILPPSAYRPPWRR